MHPAACFWNRKKVKERLDAFLEFLSGKLHSEAKARVDLSPYLGKLYVPMKGDFKKKFGPFEDHESLQPFDP
jgi:hypothetical protein